MKSSKYKVVTVFFLLLLILFGCNSPSLKKIEEERFIFGTYIKIIVYHDNDKTAKEAINAGFKEIERIDNQYNSKNHNSPVYDFNALEKKNKIEKIPLDLEGIELFKKIEKIYRLTDGKYDITIGPLMEVWGFYNEKLQDKQPSSDDIKNAKAKIDFSKVKIVEDGLIVESPIENLDTGSFLKGYALEKAKEKLEEYGIKHGFISAVSTIVTIGGKADGTPWKIGIENPSNSRELLGIIELSGESMGVSGDYQTYVEIEGKKYHHIIDKSTGFPVNDKKMIVVVGNSGLETDFLSTGLFLLPQDKIEKLLKERKEIKVLLVDADMKTYEYNNLNIRLK